MPDRFRTVVRWFNCLDKEVDNACVTITKMSVPDITHSERPLSRIPLFGGAVEGGVAAERQCVLFIL